MGATHLASKQVRFFRPVLTDNNGKSVKLKSTFWDDVRRDIDALAEKDRNLRYGGAPYYGETGVALARAYPFIRVGRVRQQADWPDTLDSNFTVAPLNLSNRNLFEAGYVVPFGASNQIAYMGPLRGIVSMGAIEFWLGAVLGLPKLGQSLELAPEVDPNLLRKINAADGVSKLSVRVPYDESLRLAPGSRSRVENALASAVDTASDEVDVELTFSYGRRTPKGTMRQELKNTVQRLTRAKGLEKVEMSLLLPDGNGFKTEHHELLKDTIAITRSWHVPDTHQITVDEAMQQIHEAIEQFRKL